MCRQPHVFLSYARGDDEPFVRRLVAALERGGVRVWRDRDAMPSRGRSFLEELRDEVEACDRVVAVVGPAALQSEFVRSEWETAVARHKQLLPVLRLGNHEQLPRYIELTGREYMREAFGVQHVPDFRDDGRFEPALAELLRLIRNPVPPMGPLMGDLPAVPPNCLARPALCRDLLDALLADDIGPQLPGARAPVHALVGMGGIGKTVLAGALVRVAALRRRFRDGVMWLRAPQAESGGLSKIRLLEHLGSAFGPATARYADESDALAAVRELMATRHAFVVLDDPESRLSINALRDSLGQDCRLLFTTRNDSLAKAVGAQVHPVVTLPREESLALLAKWHDSEKPLPPEADAVASRLGDYPLALAMVGASIQGQPESAWAELLERLECEGGASLAHEVGDYGHAGVAEALQVSLERLESSDDRRAFQRLAIFPLATELPRAMVTAYLAWPTGSDVSAKALVDRLVSRSLLSRSGADSMSLHPLLAELARGLLTGGALQKLHGDWIARYAAECKGDWHRLDLDDTYFWTHWAHHFQQAGEGEKLRLLFTDATWLKRLLGRVGLIGTLVQLEPFAHDPELSALARGLALAGAHVAEPNADVLFQLLVRIPPELGGLRSRLVRQAQARRTRWARPLSSSLVNPVGPLQAMARAHEGPITSVCMLGNEWLVAVSYDGTASLWDTKHLRLHDRLALEAGRLLHALADPAQPALFWGSDQGSVGRVDLTQAASEPVPRLMSAWKADGMSRLILAVAPVRWSDRLWLLSASSDGNLQWRDPVDGSVALEVPLDKDSTREGSLASIVAVPARHWVFVGFEGLGHVLAIAPAEDATASALGDVERTVGVPTAVGPQLAIRRLSTCGDPLLTFDTHSGALAVSHDGRSVYVAQQELTQAGHGIANIVTRPLDETPAPDPISLESPGVRSLHAIAGGLLIVGHANAAMDVIAPTTQRRLLRDAVGGGTFALASSADGEVVVSGHDDGHLRLWKTADLATPRGIRTWQHGAIVDIVAARYRSRWRANGQVARLRHDRAAGAPVGSSQLIGAWLRYALWPIREALAFSSDSELSRLELRTGKIVFSSPLEKPLPFHWTHPYQTGRFSPDGGFLAAPALRPHGRGSTRCRHALWVDLWKIDTLKAARRLVWPEVNITGGIPCERSMSLAVAPHGRMVVARIGDSPLLAWHDGRPPGGGRWRERDHLIGLKLTGWLWSDRPERMVFSADGGWLALLGANERMSGLGLIRSVDLRHPQAGSTDWEVQVGASLMVRPEDPMPVPLTAAAIDRDGSTVWIGLEDGRIASWSPRGDNLRFSTEKHAVAVQCIALVHDGEVVASAHNKTVRLWDAVKLEPVHEFRSDTTVTAITSLGHRVMAVGCADGRVGLLELENW